MQFQKIAFLVIVTVVVSLAGCGPRRGAYEMSDLPEKHGNTDERFIPFLKKQISRHPKEASNYLKLAGIYERQQKNNEAKKLLEDATEVLNEDVDILVQLSRIYLEERDTTALQASIGKLRVMDNENDAVLTLSADYALLVNDPDNALYYTNRAILKNPYNDHSQNLLGHAYLMKKDSISALLRFSQAFSMNNSDENFKELLALALDLGQTEKAPEIIHEFELSNPGKSTILSWASYYNATANYDSARLFLTECNRTQQRESTVYLEWAKYYFATKNDSALQVINLYLHQQANDLNALLLKARIKAGMGETMESIAIYESILQADSTMAIAETELGILARKVAYLRLANRKDEAQKQLDILRPMDTKQIN